MDGVSLSNARQATTLAAHKPCSSTKFVQWSMGNALQRQRSPFLIKRNIQLLQWHVQKKRLRKPTPRLLRRSLTTRRAEPPLKPNKSLQRCHSEPILYTVRFVSEEIKIPKTNALLFLPQPCTDIITPTFTSPTPSPRFANIYSKDAKVVVTVTVEGSSVPLRTMMKLESSVEEIVRVVIDKYREEGRYSLLDHDGAASSFHLHRSCFSLDYLHKKQTIGEVGSRSFYLRKSSSSDQNSFNPEGIKTQTAWSPSSSVMPPVVYMRAATSTPFPPIFSPDFIALNIHKMIRGMLKLWISFGCLQCE